MNRLDRKLDKYLQQVKDMPIEEVLLKKKNLYIKSGVISIIGLLVFVGSILGIILLF